MSMDRIKDKAGSGFIKIVDANETLIRGTEYARKNPKKAAKKTAAKVLDVGIKDPGKAIGKGLWNVGKEVTTKMLPWGAKKAASGVMTAARGTAHAARRMDARTIDTTKDSSARNKMDTLVHEFAGRGTIVDAGVAKTLQDGIAASLKVHGLITANKRSIKIDKSQLAIHVGSTIAIKGSKILLATALMHVPFLAHLPFAHLLNEQDLLDHVHLVDPLKEGAEAVAIGKLGEHKFADSLTRSNVKEKDFEMWARSGVQAKNMKAVDQMMKAVEALADMRMSPDNQDGKIKHNDIERVRAGLQAAQELSAYVQSEDFKTAAGNHQFGDVDGRASALLAKSNIYAPEGAQAAVPVEIIKPKAESAVKESVAKERAQGYFGRKLEKMKQNKLRREIHAQEDRAFKYDKKIAHAEHDLAIEDAHNKHRAVREKEAKFNYFVASKHSEVTMRRDLAIAKRDEADFKLAKTPLDNSERVSNLKRIDDLSRAIEAQQAVENRIGPSQDTVEWFGMRKTFEARSRRFDKDVKEFDTKIDGLLGELAEFDKPENQDANQAWRGTKQKLENRISKVRLKREVAQLQYDLAQSDLALGDMLRHSPDSSVVKGAALFNRMNHIEVETKLFVAKVEQDEAAHTEHRTSAWVKEKAKFSETGGAGVNAVAHFGWWSMALFPVTALPYWGIRSATTTLRDSRYLSYMKDTLGEETPAQA